MTFSLTLLATGLLGLLAQAGYAQPTPIKAGTVQLGGSARYTTSSSEYTSLQSNGITLQSVTELRDTQFLALIPAAGYFVADNLALGVSVGYVTDRLEVRGTTPGQDSYRQNSYILQVGPTAQYYHPLTSWLSVAGTLGAGYAGTRTEYLSATPTTYRGRGFYAGLTPSLVFFPLPKLGLSTAIGGLAYSHNTSESDQPLNPLNGKNNSFSADFGLSYFTLTGLYYLGR